MGQLDYYTENPDKPRQSAGQSESATAAKEGRKHTDKDAVKREEKTDQKQETPAKSAKRHKVS